MSLVPHKITALAESDAQGTSGKNIVAGAVVSLFDTSGTAVTLFDNESGTNGSTVKQTDATGQVVVYVTPGEYDEEVNGSVKRRVTVGGNSAIEVATFAALEALRPQKTGQSFVCQERANAKYTVQASGYTALPGDVTFANGRVGVLQFKKSILADKFGVTYSGDETAILQGAIERVAQEGGEIVLGGLVNVSGITIPQRVVLKGIEYGFSNQFLNNEVTPKGSGLFLISGSNNDVVTLQLRVTLVGSDLIDDFDGGIMNDYRYFGGLKDLVVYGNRSDTANPPSVVDNNTSGNGVLVKGVRYPIMQNVVVMMCAENGIKTASFDYGLGANACNNILFTNVSCLSNAQNGASLSGGDSHITKLNLGYNGFSGLSSTIGRSFIGGISWNNTLDGVNLSSGVDLTLNFQSYDNNRNGFRLSGLNGALIQGVATANGRGTSNPPTERCGVVSASSNQSTVLSVVSNGTYLGVAYQAYGFNISNSADPVVVAGCFANGNFIDNWRITSPGNLIKSSNAPD